jgi:hypothetical protein
VLNKWVLTERTKNCHCFYSPPLMRDFRAVHAILVCCILGAVNRFSCCVPYYHICFLRVSPN